MNYRFWEIEGYDGSEKIYANKFPISHIGIRQIKKILMCLTAKAGLDFDEIVGAHATRGTRTANNHPEVKLWNMTTGSRQCYHCGDNPHFEARMVKE